MEKRKKWWKKHKIKLESITGGLHFSTFSFFQQDFKFEALRRQISFGFFSQLDLQREKFSSHELSFFYRVSFKYSNIVNGNISDSTDSSTIS